MGGGGYVQSSSWVNNAFEPRFDAQNIVAGKRRGVITSFRDYDECARVWVRQSQPSGKSHSGRMYFDRRTIFSYRSNWPLAHIALGLGDTAYVLVNNERCSVTTSRHQRAVVAAINGYYGSAHTVFEVDCAALRNFVHGMQRHKPVYDYYSKELGLALASAERSRMHGRRPMFLSHASTLVEEANRFAQCFGDTPQFPTNTAEALALAMHDSTQQEEQ